MTIPPDSDMISIDKIPFSDGAIEIGRIHYLRNNLTVDQAWESLKGYLKK
jgi:hypothetical protein